MKANKIFSTLAILFTLLISITKLNAQNTTIITKEILTNKTWKVSGVTDKIIEETYDQSNLKFFYNSQLIGESYYYLSEEIESVFDESKVGETSKGKYIISRVKHAKNDNFTVMEVISISSTEIVLKNIKQTHTIKYILNE